MLGYEAWCARVARVRLRAGRRAGVRRSLRRPARPRRRGRWSTRRAWWVGRGLLRAWNFRPRAGAARFGVTRVAVAAFAIRMAGAPPVCPSRAHRRPRRARASRQRRTPWQPLLRPCRSWRRGPARWRRRCAQPSKPRPRRTRRGRPARRRRAARRRQRSLGRLRWGKGLAAARVMPVVRGTELSSCCRASRAGGGHRSQRRGRPCAATASSGGGGSALRPPPRRCRTSGRGGAGRYRGAGGSHTAGRGGRAGCCGAQGRGRGGVDLIGCGGAGGARRACGAPLRLAGGALRIKAASVVCGRRARHTACLTRAAASLLPGRPSGSASVAPQREAPSNAKAEPREAPVYVCVMFLSICVCAFVR
jgi:hypothetical protein